MEMKSYRIMQTTNVYDSVIPEIDIKVADWM